MYFRAAAWLLRCERTPADGVCPDDEGLGVAPLNSGPSLIVTSGTGQARRIPVPFGGQVLGRDTQLGPPFSADQFVSRYHVMVRRIGHGVEITDLGSSNGTYVNGTRVRAPTRLRDGDVLRIGRISLKLSAPGELDPAIAAGDRPRQRAQTAPQPANPGYHQRPRVPPVRRVARPEPEGDAAGPVRPGVRSGPDEPTVIRAYRGSGCSG
jgi:FHA domain-containing protein